VDPTERVVCTGGWAFGGRVWHCHKKGGHGVQDMHDAIKNSCDVYFYQMALRIGPDPIAATAKAFGYGGTFDIGIPGQKKGLVGSREWKKTAFKRDPVWHPGDSVPYGIGQGYINVNALQLAVMTARLANGRKALNPRLVKSVGGVEQPHGDAVPDLPFSQEHLEIVRAGMAAVANDPTGGAFKQSQLGLGDVKMAGKTGTAQVRQYAAGASRSNQGDRLAAEGPQPVHRLRALRQPALRPVGDHRARRPVRLQRRRAPGAGGDARGAAEGSGDPGPDRAADAAARGAGRGRGGRGRRMRRRGAGACRGLSAPFHPLIPRKRDPDPIAGYDWG
jgi:hypothetical protein